MTSPRCAVRALALTAAGAFCVSGPASASAAGSPVGGPQLSGSGVIVNLVPGIPPPPALPGTSFLLADMDTGQILVARAPHASHLPAATMKALIALTLIPLLNPHASIKVTQEDVNVDGTHVGIVPGTAYSVTTLMPGDAHGLRQRCSRRSRPRKPERGCNRAGDERHRRRSRRLGHRGPGPQRPGQGRPAQQRLRPGADRSCCDEAPRLLLRLD
jgi:hypothetical protein